MLAGSGPGASEVEFFGEMESFRVLL